MTVGTKYSSDEDGVVVNIHETREPAPGRQHGLRTFCKYFGKSAKAEDDGLIFVHGINHGEIKLDDIMPPWAD